MMPITDHIACSTIGKKIKNQCHSQTIAIDFTAGNWEENAKLLTEKFHCQALFKNDRFRLTWHFEMSVGIPESSQTSVTRSWRCSITAP